MQGQLPILWDRAEGFSVYDKCGNRWIDFTSTIFVSNVGHANGRVLAAMRDVLNKPLLHTYAYVNEYRVAYLKKLIDFTRGDFEKAFLLSAGTEATEAALKLMRMQGQKLGKRRPGIVCIDGNWHGRTMGAQMMSSNNQQKEWIGFLDPNMHHIPFPYPWVVDEDGAVKFLHNALEKLDKRGINLERDVCGFMLETFQGWGAVFYPVSYVRALEAICRENRILLCFDEMQAGFARTGKRFGYEHYGVKPDLICCGKGMGSGVPLSGVLGSAAIMDLPEIGNMSSTHSAGPLVCAAGLGTIEEIENNNLVAESSRRGQLLHSRLNEIKKRFPDRVSYILGKGMIAAILFTDSTGTPDPKLATAIAKLCLEKGLLVVHTGRESIKIGPPLMISDEALLEGLSVMEETIEEHLLSGSA
jgi:4-aminobutyrate aminotransferase-like enzyme